MKQRYDIIDKVMNNLYSTLGGLAAGVVCASFANKPVNKLSNIIRPDLPPLIKNPNPSMFNRFKEGYKNFKKTYYSLTAP